MEKAAKSDFLGLLSFTPSLPTKTFPEFSWASKLALIDELKVSLDEGISKEEFACTDTTLGGTCPDWNCCKNVPSFAKEIGDGSRTTLAASPFKKFESAQDVGAAERTCPEENCCRKVPSLANRAGACSNAESPGYVSEESEPVQEGGTPENGLDPLKSRAGARILEISSEPGRAGPAIKLFFRELITFRTCNIFLSVLPSSNIEYATASFARLGNHEV